MLFQNSLPALAGLVALAQAVAIEPVLLDERQLICPAGYGPAGSAVVTTNIIVSPVVINQFFEGNTIINIFGNTININNAPTSVSTTITVTSTATTTVTAGAAVATPFILGVSVAGAVKRQATGPSYIGSGGSTTADCGSASIFNLVNGQLSSGGLIVSTSAGTSFQPFSPSTSIGEISTTFSSSGNGLEWTNPAFGNGAAAFVSLNGVVEIVFNGSAPAGSSPVVLSVIPAAACPAIASSSTLTPSTTTTPSITTTTASPTASVTGAFNLQVQIPGQKKAKRQAATFIGTGGVITTDASAALSFFITSSQLFSGDGQYTTNAGVPFEAFTPLAGGSITTTFSAVGSLSWTNDAFTNGAASFCLLESTNTIQFVFTSGPTGCLAVALTPIPAGSAETSSTITTAPPISSTPLPSSSSFGPFTTGNTTTTIAPTGGLRRRY